MKNQKCEWGRLTQECVTAKNGNVSVRVAKHEVLHGEETIKVCSACLGHYYCGDELKIDSFGYATPLDGIIEEESDDYELVVFDEEAWESYCRSKRN